MQTAATPALPSRGGGRAPSSAGEGQRRDAGSRRAYPSRRRLRGLRSGRPAVAGHPPPQRGEGRHAAQPRRASLLALTTSLAGCVVGPDYARPSVETPLAYKQGGTREDSPAFVAARKKGWREARPNDAAERGDWWRVFRDPTLDRLIRLVDVDNQSLRQAVANYRQARALVASAQAALYPTVIGAPSITRTGSGGTERTSVVAAWARRAGSSTCSAASAAPSRARRRWPNPTPRTLALTRLTIQAEVATNYLSRALRRFAAAGARRERRELQEARWRSPRTSTLPASPPART